MPKMATRLGIAIGLAVGCWSLTPSESFARCIPNQVASGENCYPDAPDSSYSDSESAGARLGAQIRESIEQALAAGQERARQRRVERNDRYNALTSQATAARDAGNIVEFNRLAQQALQIDGGAQNRIWVRASNYSHYARLGDNASDHASKIRYYTQALEFVASADRRQLTQLIRWYEAAQIVGRADADDPSLSLRQRVALYDRATAMDETVVSASGRAYIEWLRAKAAEQDGNTRNALRQYRAALAVPGNDTPQHRQLIAALEQRQRGARGTGSDPAVVQLNPTANTQEGRDIASSGPPRGGPAGAGGALEQLGNIVGGRNTIGQGYDGREVHDDGTAVVSLGGIPTVQGVRVITPADLARYNTDPAFRAANRRLEGARGDADSARRRREQLETRSTRAATLQARSLIQADLSRAVQAEQSAAAAVVTAEDDREAAILRYEEGEAIIEGDPPGAP